MKKAKTFKIKYLDPESVQLIMNRYGSTTGILNTDRGLFIDGVTYPKGTVFEVGKGVLKKWEN